MVFFLLGQWNLNYHEIRTRRSLEILKVAHKLSKKIKRRRREYVSLEGQASTGLPSNLFKQKNDIFCQDFCLVSRHLLLSWAGLRFRDKFKAHVWQFSNVECYVLCGDNFASGFYLPILWKIRICLHFSTIYSLYIVYRFVNHLKYFMIGDRSVWMNNWMNTIIKMSSSSRALLLVLKRSWLSFLFNRDSSQSLPMLQPFLMRNSLIILFYLPLLIVPRNWSKGGHLTWRCHCIGNIMWVGTNRWTGPTRFSLPRT